MAAISISFEMDRGWKRMARAVDKNKFKARIRQHVALETRRNAQRVATAIRKRIRSGSFTKNAALTIHIKGSSKPLVDNGDLFKAITHQKGTWDEAFVGILKTSPVSNIAEFLHEGGAIRVTERMRGMFRMLWLASIGGIDPGTLSGRAAELWARRPGGWLPIGAGTSVITVPARPFIKDTFEDPLVKAMVKEGWEKAIQRAFRDAAGKGKQ